MSEGQSSDALLLRELRDLAVVLHRKHFSEVTQWQPLEDGRGILSQIDNMTAGMTRTVSPSPEQSSDLVKRLRKYGHVEAADALESAQAEIARLTAALEPFAEFNINGFDAVMEVVPPWAENPAKRIEPICKEHFVRARAALKGNQP